VDTQDELLEQIMDFTASTKERQDALKRVTRHVLTRVAKRIDVDWNFRKCIVLGNLYKLCHLKTINTYIRNNT